MPEAYGESIGATSQRDKSDAKRDDSTMTPFNPGGKQLLFPSAKGGSVPKRVRERIHAPEEVIMDLAYLTNVQTRNRIHSVFHCIYELIRSGCACRDPKRIRIEEPFGPDIIRPLYVMYSLAKPPTSTRQLMSIIAVYPSNNQDHVRFPCQFFSGALPLLGGLTHRIDKTDLRVREA